MSCLRAARGSRAAATAPRGRASRRHAVAAAAYAGRRGREHRRRYVLLPDSDSRHDPAAIRPLRPTARPRPPAPRTWSRSATNWKAQTRPPPSGAPRGSSAAPAAASPIRGGARGDWPGSGRPEELLLHGGQERISIRPRRNECMHCVKSKSRASAFVCAQYGQCFKRLGLRPMGLVHNRTFRLFQVCDTEARNRCILGYKKALRKFGLLDCIGRFEKKAQVYLAGLIKALRG